MDRWIVIQGIDKGITNDILAMEIRQALHHLGEITGEIIRRMADRLRMICWRIYFLNSVLENSQDRRYLILL